VAVSVASSLSSAPDQVLIGRWQRQGDDAARDEIIDRYEGLVRSIAARYAQRGEPFDDLAQVGWIGLLKAIDRFDIERDVQLVTYATPTIVGEIRRHFRDRAWAVHVPRSLQELRPRVYAVIERLTAERGAAPTISDVAEVLDVGEEEVLDALQSENARSASYLPAGHEDGGETTFEVPDEDAGYEASDARVMLEAALPVLPEREQRILRLRFEEGLTQSQIAADVGISQMHVSRLLRSSLARLREVVGEVDLQA
jgi:RNA polymerase sigma-B factor